MTDHCPSITPLWTKESDFHNGDVDIFIPPGIQEASNRRGLVSRFNEGIVTLIEDFLGETAACHTWVISLGRSQREN